MTKLIQVACSIHDGLKKTCREGGFPGRLNWHPGQSEPSRQGRGAGQDASSSTFSKISAKSAFDLLIALAS